MTDEFVTSVTERYIELFEKVSGKKFERALREPQGPDDNYVEERIERNVMSWLEKNRK
jgi:phosphoribosylaminoimidazole-succinocarboxamide synthase